MQRKAYILASIAVLFWSTAGSAFKISLAYGLYYELLFYSNLVAVLVVAIILAIQSKLGSLAKTSLKGWLNSALLGFLNPFMYYIILFNAYDILLAQEAMVLNYAWPVVLVLLSIPILHQRVPAFGILAIFISFAGTFIIATNGDVFSFRFSNPLGIAMAMGSAIFWALFWIINMKDKRDEEPKMFLNFLFGLIYITVYILIFHEFRIPQAELLLGSVYIGIFELGITFIIWLRALQLSSTTAGVANLIFIAPFLSLLFINLSVGEKILPSTWVGLLFIVGGILLQKISEKRSVK